MKIEKPKLITQDMVIIEIGNIYWNVSCPIGEYQLTPILIGKIDIKGTILGWRYQKDWLIDHYYGTTYEEFYIKDLFCSVENAANRISQIYTLDSNNEPIPV